MACAKCGSGLRTNYSAVHASQGKIISKQVTIDPPAAVTCIHIKCLTRYLKDALKYTATLSYHKARVNYAEKNRFKEIDMKYRMGEPSPQSIIGLTWQVFILKVKSWI